MPGIDFNKLRSEITMDEVLSRLNFEAVTHHGDQLRGPCPVHESSHPQSRSFAVNVRTGRYFCHKCKSQGNQLELWAAVRKMPIYEAAVDLCQSVGREVPWILRW